MTPREEAAERVLRRWCGVVIVSFFYLMGVCAAGVLLYAAVLFVGPWWVFILAVVGLIGRDIWNRWHDAVAEEIYRTEREKPREP